MPGLFDGMRISTSGIRAHRVLEEVVAQNIANASNENYTRQQVTLGTAGTVYDQGHYLGQGVEVRKIERLRDELLDDQLRGASSTAAKYEVELDWLNRLQTAYNEPSENGISAGLNNFWEAWTDVANDPESFATRSSVVSQTENLATLINDIDAKLSRFSDEIDQSLSQTITEVNALFEELAQINEDIFQIEMGAGSTANDLHDRRDAALDELSKMVGITYHEASNGMVNVFVGSHPAVTENNFEGLESRNSITDPTTIDLFWEHGEAFRAPEGGQIAGILEIRDNVIPKQRADLNAFVSTLISEVNAIYANGVPLEGHQVMESKFGYDALGVTNSSTALNLVPSGDHGAMSFTFYDSNEDVVRMASVLIDDGDSLNDIASKINGLSGLDAVLVSDPNNDGKLRITLDTTSGDNFLGEASFAVSNNTGGYDTSGFLDLVGFSQTDKTTNLSAAQPTMASRDLTELQTVLGVADVATVRSTALGLIGSFTINAFETMSESTPKTDGHIVQQIKIDIASTDSIDSIITKVNTLTAQYGMAASFNGATNKMEVTSTAQTDAEGNVVTAAGVDYLRLGFANDYRYPSVPNDEPPAGYSGKADTTGLLKTLQFNTILEGTDASTIALDSRIDTANDIHAGYKLAPAASGLAHDMAALQHAKVALSQQFTIGENFENLIATIGTEVKQTSHLSGNESLLLESFTNERDRISGVNIDEELAAMIQYQRSYEANARMFSTFDQLAQEILQLVR